MQRVMAAMTIETTPTTIAMMASLDKPPPSVFEASPASPVADGLVELGAEPEPVSHRVEVGLEVFAELEKTSSVVVGIPVGEGIKT